MFFFYKFQSIQIASKELNHSIFKKFDNNSTMCEIDSEKEEERHPFYNIGKMYT